MRRGPDQASGQGGAAVPTMQRLTETRVPAGKDRVGPAGLPPLPEMVLG
jgi:hypothetical protein